METNNLPNVLLIMEQCNPEWASVPLVGYNFYHGIRNRANITLVTHERNREALEKIRGPHRIDYIQESHRLKRYYSIISRLTSRGGVNWPLQHALSYPIYGEFNRKVFRQYAPRVIQREYDLVHAMTPILPRYPVKIIEACVNVPFLLGPVNGGVPFPPGFTDVAKKEFAQFNFLRIFSRMLPGYARTYKKAHRVLAGSTYTLEMLKDMFGKNDPRFQLFYENGILKEFIGTPRKRTGEKLELLFVGRLVPYKGADMAIEAISRLDERIRDRVHFTIVGDGSEKSNLEKQAHALGLDETVTFTGWVDQNETPGYYKKSDVFCFPSVREFGGAVALEAMAGGLPCLVADHAGLGEYVTDETGFKIKPTSREYLVNELAKKIQILHENREMVHRMSEKAIERVKEFEWEAKAEKMVEIYGELVNKQS
jgi:glycosyltransferase involved in cell wall biosynthesis